MPAERAVPDDAGTAVLLAGRTAAIEWAALLLRQAGFAPLLLEPAEGDATVRARDAPERAFASIAAAAEATDAAALIADLDDGAWPDLAGAAARARCPRTLLGAFGCAPDAPRGSDLTVSAAAGLLDLSGTPADPEGRPAVLSPHQTDAMAGAFAALWVGAQALADSPRGVAEISKLECLAMATSWAVAQWTYAGEVPTRLGLSAFQPAGVLPCTDGAIYTIVVTDEQWGRFVEAIGRPEWATLEVFATRAGRLEAADVLSERVAEWAAGLTRDEALDLFVEHRLPFALANRPEEAAELQEELSGEADHAHWLCRTTPGPAAEPSKRPARELRRPLAGTLVLDVSTIWATPFATELLAHLGARVIKVESRRHLDHVRGLATYLDPREDGLSELERSGGFREANRGKESVEIDIATAEGQALLHDLARHADVLVSNLTPGADRERRLGLSEDALWAVNPGLVIGRLSAYDPRSRLGNMTGYGYGMLLMCGYGYAGPDRPWTDRGIAYPDPLAGLAFALGLVQALTERERSGRGALVETSLFGVSATLMRHFAPGGEAARRLASGGAPAFEDCLPCRSDEWIAVTCGDSGELKALASLVGAGVADGEAWGDLARRTRAWDAQSLAVALRDRGVVAERLLDVRQVVREGRLTATGQLHIPEGETHLHFASPWVADGERIDAGGRAPHLGEHTASVLGELLDIDAAALDGLVERRVTW